MYFLNMNRFLKMINDIFLNILSFSQQFCLTVIIEEYIYVLSLVNIVILLINIIWVYEIARRWKTCILLLALSWTQIIIDSLHHLLLLAGNFFVHVFCVTFWYISRRLPIIHRNHLLLLAIQRNL